MSSYGLGRNFSAPTGADAFTYKATQDVARSGEYKEINGSLWEAGFAWVKKVDIFWNKISLTGSKRFSLNAPSRETLVSHSLLSESLFLFSAPAASSLPVSAV